MAAVRVEGLNETIRSLKKFGVEVKDLKAVFTKIGNNVVRRAETLAPVKTGNLAGSIKASKTQNKSVVRAGGARLPYAGVIHYGWPARNIEPHQFLTDAVNETKDESIDLMDKGLHDLIKTLDLN
jgi:HK97 gp10 family phage protein